MFKPFRRRLTIITSLITTRLILGGRRCHFPSVGTAGIVAVIIVAVMVEVGTVAGMAEVGAAAGLLVAGTVAGTAEMIRQLSLYRLSATSQSLEGFRGRWPRQSNAETAETVY